MNDRRTDTHEPTSSPDSPETTSSHASPDSLRGSLPGDTSNYTSGNTPGNTPGNTSGNNPRNNPRNLHEFPLCVPSITNSPGCTPAGASVPPRRVRPLRVDAWAVPASVSWTRSRTTLRKINRHSHATDWALPF